MTPAEHPMLVTPDWLAQRLDAPDLRVIDASWYLPAEGRDARAEYAAGHIPGAVHLDLGSDLADLSAPVRNTVASPEALGRVFGRAGIGTAHHVVVYDRLAGYSAGRVWWTLRYAGHDRVSLLDGGFERWRAEGHPISTEMPSHPEAPFDVRPRLHLRVEKHEVLERLDDATTRIIDARSRGRFEGTAAEPAPRKGHIPGSGNVPHDAQLEGDPPRLRSQGELEALYARAGATREHRIITTCGSGVTASLGAFVLTLLGYSDVAVYDGSWAEWGADPSVPIELGPGGRETA